MQKNVGHKWGISHTVWKALKGMTNVSKAFVISVRHSLWKSCRVRECLGVKKKKKIRNTAYASSFQFMYMHYRLNCRLNLLFLNYECFREEKKMYEGVQAISIGTTTKS